MAAKSQFELTVGGLNGSLLVRLPHFLAPGRCIVSIHILIHMSTESIKRRHVFFMPSLPSRPVPRHPEAITNAPNGTSLDHGSCCTCLFGAISWRACVFASLDPMGEMEMQSRFELKLGRRPSFPKESKLVCNAVL